jgi:tRNA(fMet)-specific endonuclease VapC
MRYLLDTNAVIDYLRGQLGVVTNIQQQKPGDIAVASVSVHELERGLAMQQNPAKKRAALTAFLSQMVVLAFDEQAARVAGQADGALRTHGITVGPLDMLIAGTALAADITLVTHNMREFSRVPGLKVEDWWE